LYVDLILSRAAHVSGSFPDPTMTISFGWSDSNKKAVTIDVNPVGALSISFENTLNVLSAISAHFTSPVMRVNLRRFIAAMELPEGIAPSYPVMDRTINASVLSLPK